MSKASLHDGEPSVHALFMQRAIALARASVLQGGGPFGAVVVDPTGQRVVGIPGLAEALETTPFGTIVSRGQNRVVPCCDPTAHAEIVAIRAAAVALADHSLHGLHLYTSCEPCPMCLAAILWARVDRIVYACTREDAAAIGFDDQHFYDEVAKPIASREIPMVELQRVEGLEAFQAWSQFTDRRAY